MDLVSMPPFSKPKRVCLTSDHGPEIDLVVDEIDVPFIFS